MIKEKIFDLNRYKNRIKKLDIEIRQDILDFLKHSLMRFPSLYEMVLKLTRLSTLDLSTLTVIEFELHEDLLILKLKIESLSRIPSIFDIEIPSRILQGSVKDSQDYWDTVSSLF